MTDSADKVRGLYAWSGAEFTADGEAEISVQASETDGSVRAIEVDLPDEGKTVQVTFNNNAQISAIGGVTSAYGVYALRGGGTAFYGGGSITAKDAGRQNVAVYATGEGTTFNSDGNLKAEGIGGSSYAMGMWFDTNMQATLSGYTEAIGRDSAGTNYGFYAGGGASVEAARADAKASGGEKAYGLYLLGASTTSFSNSLTAEASGASDRNIAVYAKEENTVLSSSGNLRAEGVGGSSYAMGLWFDDNMKATILGNTEAIGRDSAGTNYGFYAGGGAGVEVARAHAKASGGQNAYGLYLLGAAKTSFSDKLTAEATGASGNNYGAYVSGAGSLLSAQNAEITSEGTAVATRAGGVAQFAGDVTTDAAITADASGENSKITFEAGLASVRETVMKAAEGAAIEVNSKGAGAVRYTGTTDITGTNLDGTLDMMMSGAGSYWNLTGNSRATNLVNNGALLDMTADGGAFSTLTLENLSGENGWIKMDIDATKNTDNSDMILVTDTFSGNQYVDLSRIEDNAQESAVGTVFAKVNNNEGKFIANDTEGTLFYNRYVLGSKDTEEEGYQKEWYIQNVEQITPEPEPEPDPTPDPQPEPDEPAVPDAPRETTTVNSVMSAASLNYHTWRSQNDKLMQRMGDLRKGGGANNGAWFRFGGSKISLGGGHGFDNEYMYYEVGYDRIIRETSQYTWFGGVAFSYGEGDSSYSRGDGDNESKAVSLYLTQINKGGSYLDLVFKLGRWDNDFAVYNTYGERITGETESTGISFSAEYGKKIALNKNGFYIEPQAQLTYGHLDGDTYTTSNGVSVHQDGIESLVAA